MLALVLTGFAARSSWDRGYRFNCCASLLPPEAEETRGPMVLKRWLTISRHPRFLLAKPKDLPSGCTAEETAKSDHVRFWSHHMAPTAADLRKPLHHDGFPVGGGYCNTLMDPTMHRDVSVQTNRTAGRRSCGSHRGTTWRLLHFSYSADYLRRTSDE